MHPDTHIGSRPSPDTAHPGEGVEAATTPAPTGHELSSDVEEFLRLPLGDTLDLDTRLAAARSGLEQWIEHGACTAADLAVALDLLVRVHDFQCAQNEEAAARAVGGLAQIRSSIQVLSTLTPREFVQAVPQYVSADLQLDRVMISAINGTIWAPKSVYTNNFHKDRDFVSFVDGARIPLRKAGLETEMVRRRTPLLISNPQRNARTYRDIVAVSRTRSYIGAPLLSHGRVLGILHADRAQSDSVVTQDDLEMLDIYATCASIAYEAALLRAQFRATPAWARSVQDLGRTLRGATDADARRRLPPPPEPETGAYRLTVRERQVLAQMTTGATNGQIGRALTVSEETVKSHLKQIFKKLGVSTRSEAIARFSAQALCRIR